MPAMYYESCNIVDILMDVGMSGIGKTSLGKVDKAVFITSMLQKKEEKTVATTPSTPKDASSVSLQIPSLTATNYTTWAIKMEVVMDAQGSEEEDGEGDLGIAEDPVYGSGSGQKARLHTLKNEFELLKMKGESVDDFAGKLAGMVTKYNSLGSTIKDEDLVRKLLDLVPDKYLQLVASIEQYSDVDTMPFDEAIGRLKAYKDRLKLRHANQTNDNSLLLTKMENQSSSKGLGRGLSYGTRGRRDRGGRENWRGRGNTRGRGQRGGYGGYHEQRYNGKGKDKKHVRCFKCDQTGHYAWDCKGPKEKGDEVNLTQTPDEEPTLLLSVFGEETTKEVMLNEEKILPGMNKGELGMKSDMWYLDNGASNHMTSQREMFSMIDDSVTGQVRMVQQEIRDVYYIPALQSNIISLGQMTEASYKVEMMQDYLWLRDEMQRLVMKVQCSANRLYKITLKVSKPVCLVAKAGDEAWLWHARLGHVSFATLEAIGRNNLVAGMPAIKHPKQVCEGCMVAKQTRLPFPQETTWRASKPLELIHADLCGPITPSTMGGNKFFFLLVDDYSRYMWVYLLKSKNEAFLNFKKFKATVEKESELKVGTLRTDRGGEFVSKEFLQFCEDHGIKRQLTAPYTPQQNGVVERRNRTVMEVTRSFLKTMDVPETLWGEAVRHAVYILNRVSTRSVKDQTPYEGWRGKKPVTAMVYLGTEIESKAYRMFNPRTGRICVTRDVKFDEMKCWNWIKCSDPEKNSSAGWVQVRVQDGDHVGPEEESSADWSQNTPLTPTNQNLSPISLFDVAGTYSEGEQVLESGNSQEESSQTGDSVASSKYDDTPSRFRPLAKIYDSTMFYEVGVFSMFYNGKEMPKWINCKSKGPSISFTVPSSPKKLRGLNFLCIMEKLSALSFSGWCSWCSS
ncbi:hypothetical protein E3N88_13809 [Mikania micrantha]|uniref:Integrase catalytic domain-containing protein n=1 Tax=Mikania micrantha TaxID=192012 RepID=A0A5N6NZN2_9ASTR|nr:hypothetical protein E3N88_13809 [Mikania micrantha]